MGLSVRKTIKLAKGVNLNIGKTGASISVGGKGIRYNISTRDLGIPALGVKKSRKTKKSKASLVGDADGEAKLEAFLAEIEELKTIHQVADETVDWEHIMSEEPPFEKGEKGPGELEAIKELEDFDPGFFCKLFGGGKDKKEELEKAVEEAEEKDEELYERWEVTRNLADRVLKYDLEAYLEIIEAVNPLEDLLEYGGDFEFGALNSSVMEVEFSAKIDDVVPKDKVTVLKSGKASIKPMSKTDYYALVQDYICSASIRIARDLFALLPIKAVIVHALDESVDTSTGLLKEGVLLSARYNRATMEGMNLERIDPSDAMVHFEHHMKFLKTKGLQEVEKINERG